MAGNRSTGATFWVTYSDLATGLMIVFMVVMLLMVIMSKQQDEKMRCGISWPKSRSSLVPARRLPRPYRRAWNTLRFRLIPLRRS
jgi:hypothetical protein